MVRASADRRLFGWLLTAAVFGLADVTTAAVLGGAFVRPALAPVLFLYVLPAYLAVGAVAWLVERGVVRVIGLSRARLFSQGLLDVKGELLAALSSALALYAGAAYGVVLFSAAEFNNRELASLLVVLVLLGLLGAAAGLWLALFWVLTRSFESRLGARLQKAGVYLALLALPGVLAAIARHNREGLEIVGPGIFAGPLAAAVTLIGFLFLAKRVPPRPRPRVVLAGGLLSVALATAAGYARPRLSAMLVDGELWSSKLILLARKATDFDRDGYSSLFGGGDCAPFDRKRHPAALELPKDGIDNDCYGGDRAEAYQSPPPERYPRPAAFSGIQNAIVLTIEALRADAVSFVNGRRPRTTPNLDALAERSVVFPRTYSSADATVWAMGSFWTTLPPAKLTWKRREHNDLRYLDESVEMIPSILRKRGFDTHAFVVDFVRLRAGEGIGLEAGFSTYDDKASTGRFRSFPSAGITDKVVRLLERKRARPFLLWMHFIEPHAPYVQNPGSPNFGSSSRDLYQSEVWGVDRQLGRIVDTLKRTGLFEKTLIFVTGDHGEAFGEHGKRRHGSRVYDEQTRTPGILWVPGAEHRVLELPISHQDFGSTLLNLLDVEADFSKLRGRNLLPLITGERNTLANPSVVMESHAPNFEMVALVKGRFKLVYTKPTGEGTLFELDKDPGELVDVSEREPTVYAAMMDEMRGYLATQVAYE